MHVGGMQVGGMQVGQCQAWEAACRECRQHCTAHRSVLHRTAGAAAYLVRLGRSVMYACGMEREFSCKSFKQAKLLTGWTRHTHYIGSPSEERIQ